MPTEIEGTRDVGLSASSTCPIDSMTHVEKDPSDSDEAEYFIHEENLFILTGNYNIVFDKNNTLSQTLLIPFFCMLYLIVATNVDHVAYKATFNQKHAQFIIWVACEEMINLSQRIFEGICYKPSIFSTTYLSSLEH